ncbi:MAG: hypothetical protein Q8T11_16325 [Elusimicrobiota bacterium]|nr:hypothetical protein [Elusimicrobiota bacterium]
MTKWPAVLALALSASTARADAFSELRRFAGPSASDLARVPMPSAVLVEGTPAAAPPLIRTTSTRWNPSFPISREAVAAAGRAAGTKDWSKFSCEYEVGAASARCDFAYDVWPEMCWYGFDHVVADLDLKSPKRPKVVLREWRAD